MRSRDALPSIRSFNGLTVRSVQQYPQKRKELRGALNFVYDDQA